MLEYASLFNAWRHQGFPQKRTLYAVQGSSYSNLIAINGSNTSNLCLMMMSCSWGQRHTEHRNRFRCLYTDPHEGKFKRSVLFILGFPEIILSHNTKFLWLQQRFLCQSQAKSWDSKQFVWSTTGAALCTCSHKQGRRQKQTKPKAVSVSAPAPFACQLLLQLARVFHRSCLKEGRWFLLKILSQ